MKKLTHISFFAGGGGLDLGLKWAGFETIAAVEIKDYGCKTLRSNFPSCHVFGPPTHSGNVQEITGNEIREKLNFWGEIDLISGGPPCQPFSVAAGQRWGKEDPRYRRTGNLMAGVGDLLPEYIRLISELSPKAFILENVEGLLTWNNGEYLSKSLQPISEQYVFSKPTTINAANYGVPQYRERFIIIGTKLPNKTPTLPIPTHFKEDALFDSYNTVSEALDHFSEDLPNHQLREHGIETAKRYDALEFGERDKQGRVDRLHPNKPSKTIISGGDRGGGRSHIHPYLPRTISPRECARLQTFPDDYIFSGTMSRQFTQIGNAVPPLLAYKLGRHIIEEIFEDKTIKGIDLSSIKHPIISGLYKSNSVYQ